MELSLSERLEFETLLSELFANFVNFKIDEIDDKINYAFERIGKHLRIDRCHLVLYEKQMLTHAWKAKDIDIPVPLGLGAESFPWTLDELLQNKIAQLKNQLEMNGTISGKRLSLNIILKTSSVKVRCFSMPCIKSCRSQKRIRRL